MIVAGMTGKIQAIEADCTGSRHDSVALKQSIFFKLEDHATTISQKASLVNLTLSSVFQVDKAHFEIDTFHKRLLLKFNSIELLLPVAFKGMIAPCGHICFHWAKCSNNLHVWLKFAKTKMMFVE